MASSRRAATAYAAAMDKAGKSDLGEKSAHKLGWAYYRLDETRAEAQQAFSYQRATWPKGPLAADAAFMEAECLFKQKKYSEALTAYERVKDTSSKDFQVLTLLHGARPWPHLPWPCSAATRRTTRKETWQKASALLDRLVKENPDTAYLPEALYERGWALQNLGRFDEARASTSRCWPRRAKAEPSRRPGAVHDRRDPVPAEASTPRPCRASTWSFTAIPIRNGRPTRPSRRPSVLKPGTSGHRPSSSIKS